MSKNAPNALWTPSQERRENSLLHKFLHDVNDHFNCEFQTYDDLHQWSVSNIADFWSYFWDWTEVKGDKGDVVIDDPDTIRPGAHFFPQGHINYAENILIRDDDAKAITFWGESKIKRELSWADLHKRVSQAEQMMRENGIVFGDRVASYLPNVPEAIIALLACANIGAIFTTASPDFGVTGVMDRFGQIEPKLFLYPDGYYYNGKWVDVREKASEVAEKLGCIAQEINYKDGRWKAIEGYTPQKLTYIRHPFNHPLYILFSSGTTGIPKCIVHSTGGVLLQHLKEHQLQCDVQPNEPIFWFTTCSWMMWHWLASGLGSGAPILLYDGSPFVNHGRVLFEYVEKSGMTLFGTSAKFIEALRKVNWYPDEDYDLSSLRTLGSTGSPLVHEGFDYIHEHIKQDIHIISLSGGTDIVSCFMIGNPLSPVYRGELQCAGLGLDIIAANDQGQDLGKGGGQGELVCQKPFPCMPVTFWGDDNHEKYKNAYFDDIAGLWCHGDWVEQTETGGFIIYGRSDATLNPGGVRIGTAEIYRQVEKIPDVLESICIGQSWKDDVRVVLFVVLKEGIELSDELKKEIRTEIRKGASPRHVPAKIVAITAIPRTRSGKIVELAVRNVVEGRAVKNIEALSNPEALDQFKDLEKLQS